MSAPGVVAVRRSAPLVPVRPIVEHAAALADPALMTAVEEFLQAHEASRATLEALHLSQAAGTALEDDAERLYGEAENAWKRVASGWAAGMFVAEEVRDAGREYAPRRPVKAEPTVGDWRDSIGRTDWARGRGGAA